ncbi:hypothetical protein GC209_14545 [bacterium]|nr:hypothetical protein [bacterium]
MAKTEEYLKELKEMLAFAKKGPVNIGVCFGKKPEGAEVKLHKKRDPSMLGRLVKADGETSKVAIGTFTVDGKSATFNCLEDPPVGLGIHLKKFFKSVDMAFTSVTVIDPSGKALPEEGDDANAGGPGPSGGTTTEEEQTEREGTDEPVAETGGQTVPETNEARSNWEMAWSTVEGRVAAAIAKGDELAGKLSKLRDFIMGKVNAAQFEEALKALPSLMGLLAPPPPPRPTAPEGGTAAPTDATGKPIDPKDLVRRLAAIKPQLAGLTGPIGEKLNQMYQAGVDLMKGGDLPKAAQTVGQIETALIRVGAAGQTTPQPTTTSQPQPEATPEPTPGPDTRSAGLTKAVAALRAQVQAKSAGDAHDAMMNVLDTAEADVGKGEAEKAMAGLKRVQDGLKQQAEVDRLAPMVARAASAGMVADVNALNNLFNMVVDSIPAADHAKAMANLGRVEAMIAAGLSQDKSNFEAEVPPDVKPFATARLNWMFTRRSIKDELSKLEAEISRVLAAAGVPTSDLKVDGALMTYIEGLDTRLETKLAEIVSSDTGDARDKLKVEARGLIEEYKAVLQRDFFKDVDTSNGFLSVAVTSTAQKMLSELSGVLG